MPKLLRRLKPPRKSLLNPAREKGKFQPLKHWVSSTICVREVTRLDNRLYDTCHIPSQKKFSYR
jgi:hypothetical protein